jgi:hypothetical protein
LSEKVTRFETDENLSGLTSYSPPTVYPPPPGSRESSGAVMLNFV